MDEDKAILTLPIGFKLYHARPESDYFNLELYNHLFCSFRWRDWNDAIHYELTLKKELQCLFLVDKIKGGCFCTSIVKVWNQKFPNDILENDLTIKQNKKRCSYLVAKLKEDGFTSWFTCIESSTNEVCVFVNNFEEYFDLRLAPIEPNIYRYNGIKLKWPNPRLINIHWMYDNLENEKKYELISTILHENHLIDATALRVENAERRISWCVEDYLDDYSYSGIEMNILREILRKIK